MNDLFISPRSPSDFIIVDDDIDFEWSVNDSINGFDLHLDGGELSFSEHFFSQTVCQRFIALLQENDWKNWREVDWSAVASDAIEEINFKNINWKQDYIRFFGKTVPLPRLTAWYGDAGASYKYSGIQSDPNPWNEGLLYIRDKIQDRTGARFNSVLLNWYRDGSDSLSWHADDEKELGPQPTIASASFGSTREFVFKPKNAANRRLKLRLASGSLVIMSGKTQENWVHSVPKRKSARGSRFNLTFRQIDQI